MHFSAGMHVCILRLHKLVQMGSSNEGDHNLFSDLHPRLKKELLAAECETMIKDVALFRHEETHLCICP